MKIKYIIVKKMEVVQYIIQLSVIALCILTISLVTKDAYTVENFLVLIFLCTPVHNIILLYIYRSSFAK